MLVDRSMSSLFARRIELQGLPGRLRKSRFKYIDSGFWGEHCVECSVPFCYKSCDKFRRTPTGYCRRFEHGIEPVSVRGWGRAYSVQFRPWGKLGFNSSGLMMPTFLARVVDFADSVFIPFIRLLNCLFKIEFGRPSPMTYYLTARRMFIERFLAMPRQAQQWIISCYAFETLDLLCFSSAGDSGSFQSKLHLEKGWNEFAFDIAHLKGKCGFWISSFEGTSSPVIFFDLAIVSGSDRPATERNTPQSVAKNPARYVKCVAWDLDNTLWDGILANDGADSVRLRPAVLDVVRELDRRGIVSTICSKNDHENAWAKLRALGIEELFVFPQINWNPKSENIKLIAKDMNLGLDAFAFVDDSIHERGEVSMSLPMVRVYSDKDVLMLLGQSCFNPPLSLESARRRQSYLDEMKRQASRSAFSGSREEFVRDSQLKLSLGSPEEPDVRLRCWELVNRTNQLTLAARRYSEESFASLIDDESVSAYSIRCNDKYGDYGIVGFIAFRDEGSTVEVAEFVMSCRVAARYCEQSVLLAAAQKYARTGAGMMTATLVRTERNKALVDAFNAMPFSVSESEGRRKYELSLKELPQLMKGVFTNEVEWA